MQAWTECFVGVRNVAICIPIPGGAQPIELFWYGMLASFGIFLGAWLASKYIEREGEDANLVWDSLLWVLIPGLLGARLWYVGQEIVGGRGLIYINDPIQIINFRGGGMNIFGGVVFGLIAVIVYTRQTGKEGWLLADAALLGALVGQAIGRIGNWVNQELYGPPTTLPWGVKIPAASRIGEFANLTLYPVDTTRFHPTFFYEFIWLLLSFAALVYLWRRFKPLVIRGTMTGGYLLLAGVGRFWIEFFRPDQPRVPLSPPYNNLSFGRLFALLYVFAGLLLLLDRYGYIRIPFIKRPASVEDKQPSRSTKAKEARERRRERAKAKEA